MILHVASPTVWVLDWDVLNEKVSGTMELSLTHTIKRCGKAIEKHTGAYTLRVEEPKFFGVDDLEKRLIKTLQSAI